MRGLIFIIVRSKLRVFKVKKSFYRKEARFQPLRSITDVLYYSTAQADRKTLSLWNLCTLSLIYADFRANGSIW